jgi:4-amino-4-deoxy-L-arabinose transferase-like glycosyltransferase
MSRRPSAFTLRLGAIVLAGVALRALYLYTVGRKVTGVGDWFFYHWEANDLAAGHFYVEPFRWHLTHKLYPSAGHPPLYPTVLAGVSWLGGHSVMWQRTMGLLFGSATISLMGVLGRRIGGERLGLAAAGICAAYPLMVVIDGALMSETAYLPLVVVVLLVAWSALERPRRRVALGLGAAIGLAALARSEALLLVPVLAWPVAVRGGSGWATRAALATLGCALVLAPWTIRNAIQIGGLIPISTNDSTVLVGANCPKTYSGPDIGFWRFDCLTPQVSTNEGVQAGIWRSQGLRYEREHASRLWIIVPIRILRTWELYQPRRQVLFAEGRWIRGEQMGVAVFYLLALFAFPGAFALRRAGRPLLVLLAPAAVVMITVIVGYGHPRFRLVFEPSLMLLAAAGGLWAWDRLRARRAQRTAGTGGASSRETELARAASASS